MSEEKTGPDFSETPPRSAKAKKAAEVQRAGSAKAGAGHDAVEEGGKPPPPTHSKGEPMPAKSRADADGTPEAGTSAATAGKAEKAAAQQAAAAKEQHGRGHRKSD